MRCILSYVREEVWLRNARYVSLIFAIVRKSCLCKSRQCAPWWCSDECNYFYCIESGECCWWIEVKIFVHDIWAAQEDLSRTRSPRLVSYLLFKVTQKVPPFPSTSIFTNVGNHFVWTDENILTIEGSSVTSRWLELSQDDWLYAASGRQRQGRQRIGCLLGTRGVMWVLHLNQ